MKVKTVIDEVTLLDSDEDNVKSNQTQKMEPQSPIIAGYSLLTLNEHAHMQTLNEANMMQDMGGTLTCQECRKTFLHYNSLKSHMRYSHKNKVTNNDARKNKLKICLVCSQEFPSSVLRLHHVKKLHPDSLFYCNLCHRFFTTKHCLQSHQRNIHGSDVM